MSKQPWSQNTIARGVAAVLFAATLLVATEAGAHPISDSLARGLGHQVATFGGADEGLQTDELDPTDDGSIIIECVALPARQPPHERPAERSVYPHHCRAAVSARAFDMLAQRA
jgi:hypothetical protein